MAAIISSNTPILIVLVLLFSAYLLPIFSKKRYKIVKWLTVVSESVLVIGGIYLAWKVLTTGQFNYILGGWEPPWGLELTIDPLSVFFIITVGLISLPIAIYSLPNMACQVHGERRAGWFFTLFLLHIAGLCGMAFSRDLFNLYVFIEVTTISAVALVAADNSAASIEAAFKYLIMATLGSGFILAGIGIMYIITGNLNMIYVHRELALVWTDYPHALWIACSFFLVGFGIKSAVFPLHSWLPDAHSAAVTPASALLSGLAVKGFIIGLIKVLYIAIGVDIFTALGISTLLRILGMISLIAGSIFALSQHQLKRRLAFSTIAQLGYVFLGLGIGNETAISGALFHIISHGLIKSVLFLAAGSIISQSGETEISQLAGIGKKMPYTMGAFTAASLAMIGIPLFSGFVGKWNMILGSLESANWLAAIVIIVGSLLAAGYLLPIVRTAYFETGNTANIEEVSRSQLIPVLVLAAFIIIFGCFPSYILELTRQAATMLLFN